VGDGFVVVSSALRVVPGHPKPVIHLLPGPTVHKTNLPSGEHRHKIGANELGGKTILRYSRSVTKTIYQCMRTNMWTRKYMLRPIARCSRDC
jgi:hypothetical protein